MKETIQYIFVLGRILVSEERKHDVICKGTVYQNIVQSLLYCFTLISGLDKFCLIFFCESKSTLLRGVLYPIFCFLSGNKYLLKMR